MRDAFDVRIYLAPPEEVRRSWKVQRDCSRRGYTTDQVLAELDRREHDSQTFIRPQRRHADLLVSFLPADGDANAPGDQAHLDAELTLCDELVHPDLSPFVNGDADGPMLDETGDRPVLRIPGRIDPERAAAIEESIWERMHFATHLRPDGSVSSRSARSCTAPSRWRSCNS